MSESVAPTAVVARRRWLLGAGVWALSWVFAAAGLVIAMVWGPSANSIPYDIHREFFVPDIVVAVIYAPVAALVLTRSRHPLGWLLAATAVGFAVTAFGLQYALLAAEQPGLPMLGTVVNLVTWAWSVGAFSMVLVMPWLLSVDSPTGWRLRAAWAGAAVTLTVCLPLAFLQIPGRRTTHWPWRPTSSRRSRLCSMPSCCRWVSPTRCSEPDTWCVAARRQARRSGAASAG